MHTVESQEVYHALVVQCTAVKQSGRTSSDVTNAFASQRECSVQYNRWIHMHHYEPQSYCGVPVARYCGAVVLPLTNAPAQPPPLSRIFT